MVSARHELLESMAAPVSIFQNDWGGQTQNLKSIPSRYIQRVITTLTLKFSSVVRIFHISPSFQYHHSNHNKMAKQITPHHRPNVTMCGFHISSQQMLQMCPYALLQHGQPNVLKVRDALFTISTGTRLA